VNKLTLPRFHFWTGLVTVVIFLYTGMYLRLTYRDWAGVNLVVRHQYRANHIYILLVGLINLALSLRRPVSARPGPQRAARIGSACLFIAPMLLLAAFFHDPPKAGADRMMSAFGLYLTALGMILHLFAAGEKEGAIT
jgi:hypothetical protein